MYLPVYKMGVLFYLGESSRRASSVCYMLTCKSLNYYKQIPMLQAACNPLLRIIESYIMNVKVNKANINK